MAAQPAAWLCSRISGSTYDADAGLDGAAWALMKPVAPIRHPIPWGTCWEGVGAAGEEKGAATMRICRHHTPVTWFLLIVWFRMRMVMSRLGREDCWRAPKICISIELEEDKKNNLNTLWD